MKIMSSKVCSFLILHRRLLTLIAGFGNQTFNEYFDYFFWIPLIMPHIGALIGAVTYYFMIEHHHPEKE